ncbi:MAG: tRNA1(Val) (adenine(37)-N6)-methyltransferase [Bacillota bacterium]|nr:tRNA1(Val) (adenine(37)-N6)-methyltransferase [Bacillota bacterium]
MERIEKTGFGEMKLIQDPEDFCYGIDAVILADFSNSICPDAETIVDLGTGNGIIPLILSHKNRKASITGIELQAKPAEMARRSIEMNGLQNRLSIKQGDIAEPEVYSGMYADMVTCNPPYFSKGGGIPNEKRAKFIARHETTAVFEDFAKAAATLLNGKGDFFIVHRPSRLVDIFYYCRKYKLEPKTIRFVAPKEGCNPNIVLIHCTANGGKELKFRQTLFVYNQDGSYTDEIHQIYERKSEQCHINLQI